MNKLRWLALLMGITILGITGFQLYWLKENYDREQRTLAIKSEVTFRETIQHLQMAKLNLEGFTPDTTNGDGKLRIMMDNGKEGMVNLRMNPRAEIVSTINMIRGKLRDSLKRRPNVKGGMIVSMDKSSLSFKIDTTKFRERIPGPHNDHIYQLLYGMDSLQDSLRLNEINAAYTVALKSQQLNIPFTVKRLEGAETMDDPTRNEVTVGFANPITYQMKLGNTFPYLMKRIGLPILFSFVLLGITLLSFILLYRTLLRQRKLAGLKNEFISNITHELKTPIATVGVAIEALKNFNAIQDPARTREYLDISSNELQRLNLLVDKVLKLSMFEKKEIELKYETFNLKELVEEVTGSMRLQIEKHHARVSLTGEGDLGMQGDKLHLQSVIFNLLDNALKYSKSDPTIQFNLKGLDDTIIMEVTDNGIGIPAEYHNKVFDKFFRIRHGDTHNAKGYGLGLSYVAHVLQKHQGSIAIDSQPGIGTKFIITLPKNPPGSKEEKMVSQNS